MGTKILLTTVALALSLAADASAATIDPSTIATGVAGRPLTVISDHGYAGYFGRALVGAPDGRVILSQDAYRDASAGGGRGLLVLLHETGHATGIADERQATCYALAQMRPALRAYFHVIGREADRRYRAAVRMVQQLPPVYRGACATGPDPRREAVSAAADSR